MITDDVRNMRHYRGLNPGLDAAIDWIFQTDCAALAQGSYPIRGEEVYALVKPRVETCAPPHWEAHALCADVHVMLEGEEAIFYATDREAGEPVSPYCEEEDFRLYDGIAGDTAHLGEGRFVVLLPGEPHRPGCPGRAKAFSRKMVIKVAWPNG